MLIDNLHRQQLADAPLQFVARFDHVVHGLAVGSSDLNLGVGDRVLVDQELRFGRHRLGVVLLGLAHLFVEVSQELQIFRVRVIFSLQQD